MNRIRLLIASCLSLTSCFALANDSGAFLQGAVYELLRDTSQPSCVAWPKGLPDGVWGNGGEYVPDGEHLSASGDVLITSAIYKPTGVRVSHTFYKSRQSCLADLSPQPMTAAAKNDSQGSYVDRLQRDFGSRLYFSSAEAEALVKKINIDCKAPDGRYLPLYNALLARLDEGSTPDAWMETSVVNTGKKLQVFDSVRLKSGRELTPQLTLEINEFGGYETHGVRPQALSNACFGSYGPIWKL
ncbi:hypothetical protein IB260_28030 [Pseudomonas sp. PDM23]|uniref:hypothetical protein n=1 Tax=unclassified Pseudomonas TaxID=196821 RepID=UPI001780A085|nr:MULTISPECIES: hypothetical protein [unclassified Pseudomonas]MBD9579201.1 hypothetical protein [Pseudomonas sp. PDM23]MBD9672813.1 hypothetical protein [Pseudomonas sp. PDM21]